LRKIGGVFYGCFPPCGRAYFLLLRQKKVAKEKATPGAAPATRVPCATRLKRGLRNSGCALRQSSPFLRLSLRCSAPLMGTREASWTDGSAQEKANFGSQTSKETQNELCRFLRDALPGPLGGAEQRSNAGGLRRALFEGQSPELRSRPAFRVAQGTRVAGTDPGSPSFCLLFLGEARKSETPRKGGTLPPTMRRLGLSRPKQMKVRHPTGLSAR